MSSLMVVAGEVSGDIHAGNMLAELHSIRPDVTAFGVGGDRLADAGLEGLARCEELAHMGLFEVVRELPRIRGIMRRLVDEAERRKPELAVLVDSPDFNLRLAAKLKRLGVPVVLYVSPQLWAWRKGRVRTVRRRAREVLCILPFEVPFYREHGVPARFVGHPLVDDIVAAGLLDHGRPVQPGRLALLPGSRAMEIRQLLPEMIEGLRRLEAEEVSEAVLLEAPGATAAVDEVLQATGGEGRLRRVRGDQRRLDLASSALAWTASGTATVECALLDVPMVVGYRLQGLSFLLAKMLVDVPHAALANLIAGRRAVPELLQSEFRADRLVEVTRQLLAGGDAAQRSDLATVRQRLGEAGASRRAAEAVAEHMG